MPAIQRLKGDIIPGMTRERMRQTIISQRGDVYCMAEYLKAPPRLVRTYVYADEELKALMESCRKIEDKLDGQRASQGEFVAYLRDYTQDLSILGLQKLEEIARQETIQDGWIVEKDEDGNETRLPNMVGLNAAALKVKMEAARTLAALHTMVQAGSETGGKDIMAELNALYQQSAPRIKEIRQTTITIEAGSKGALIEHDDPSEDWTESEID